jgi:hypothetical protein
MILWGPPGVGKTTLAQIIAKMTKSTFVPFSAVMAGIKEIKEIMATAEKARRLGRRTIPFVAGGAGYLRQLHQGRTFIEQGHVYHLGGGIRHWLIARDRGFIKAAGLRADGGVYVFVSGISFDGHPRPQAAASGSVFVAF